MSLFFNLFTLVIYQPFFNLLVFIYWLLGVGPADPDMGVAVIILTLIIRFLMLPLSLAGSKREPERREIEAKVKEVEEMYIDEPIKQKKAIKQVIRKSQTIIWSELVSLGIQIIIILMLYRIFTTGLEGQDFHLLYSFMPELETPFNLLFLNRIDLSQTSFILNFIQSGMIFLFETIAALTSPYPHTRAEVIRLQLTLPLISFFIFMFMPAGKKLFVITALAFSMVVMIFKYVRQRFFAYAQEKEAQEENLDANEPEKIVVGVK